MRKTFQAKSFYIFSILLPSLCGLFSCTTNAVTGHNLEDLPPGTQTITVYGRIDPRLTAYLINIYGASNRDNKSCIKKNHYTGGTSVIPGGMTAPVKPDKEGNYRVTLPYQYVGENDCGFLFSSSTLRIQRHPDDDKHAKISIAKAWHKITNTCTGTRGGERGCGGKVIGRYPKLKNKFFQLGSGSKVTCFTGYYERLESSTFTCEPHYSDAEHSVNDFVTTEIQLDVTVDEEKSFYVYPYDKLNKKPSKPRAYGVFTDYEP